MILNFLYAEQLYGVANYEKYVWFKRYSMLSTISGDDWGLVVYLQPTS